jgi:hypothetical protein
MGKQPVSYTWFRVHYQKEFKPTLKIHPPQLDACGICLQFKGKIKAIREKVHKELLQRFLEKHHKEADARYSKLRQDRDKINDTSVAKEQNQTIHHGTVSSGSINLTPCSQTQRRIFLML